MAAARLVVGLSPLASTRVLARPPRRRWTRPGATPTQPPHTPIRAAGLPRWVTRGEGSAAAFPESNDHPDSPPTFLPRPHTLPLSPYGFVFRSRKFLTTHFGSAAASTDLTGVARCWRAIRVSQLGVRSRPVPGGAAPPPQTGLGRSRVEKQVLGHTVAYRPLPVTSFLRLK